MKIPSLSSLVLMLKCKGIRADSSTASLPIKPSLSSDAIAMQSHFPLLRVRWASYFLGDNYLPFAQPLHAEMTKISRQAKQWLGEFQLDKQGLWEDLPLDAHSLKGQQRLGAQLYATYQRIFLLARAYRQTEGELENNRDLHEALVESLAFLHDNFYHVGTAEWGNWWYWQLGIGRVVNDTLVILYDQLPHEVLSNYIDTSRYFVPRPTHLSEGYGAPYSSAPLMFESSAVNRIDNAQIVLIRGILDNSEKDIQSAVDALSGIAPFVIDQHRFCSGTAINPNNVLPYSTSNNHVIIESLGMLMGLVANTPWQATDPNLLNIYPLLLDACRSCDIGKTSADIRQQRVTSHIIRHDQKVAQAMLSAILLYLPCAPAQYQFQLAVNLKMQLLLRRSPLPVQPKIFTSYQIAQQLIDNPEVKVQPLHGHTHLSSEIDRATGTFEACAYP